MSAGSRMRLLGGGSGLQQVVSDMNSNIAEYNVHHTTDSVDIALEGTASGTAIVSSSVLISVPHSLGYRPQALVWVSTNATTSQILPATLDVTLGAGVTFATLFDYVTTDSFLFIRMQLGSGSTFAGVHTFKYQLLVSPAN